MKPKNREYYHLANLELSSEDEKKAKRRISRLLNPLHYDDIREEWIVWVMHKGILTPFPIDLHCKNHDNGDEIFINFDGGIHSASKIQIGKTENRDDTLVPYFNSQGQRYVRFPNTEDVISPDGYTDKQILIMLGIEAY